MYVSERTVRLWLEMAHMSSLSRGSASFAHVCNSVCMILGAQAVQRFKADRQLKGHTRGSVSMSLGAQAVQRCKADRRLKGHTRGSVSVSLGAQAVRRCKAGSQLKMQISAPCRGENCSLRDPRDAP
jgi:hypothetical protein